MSAIGDFEPLPGECDLRHELSASAIGPTKSYIGDHMTRFPYAAWFLDNSVPVGEQDRDWVACFYVIASDAERAKNWGDRVANAYCSKRTELQFVRSYIDSKSDGWADTTPTITDGEIPTDDQIGW